MENMKENLRIIKKKVMEYFILIMEINMKENGKMIKEKDVEKNHLIM